MFHNVDLFVILLIVTLKLRLAEKFGLQIWNLHRKVHRSIEKTLILGYEHKVKFHLNFFIYSVIISGFVS